MLTRHYRREMSARASEESQRLTRRRRRRRALFAVNKRAANGAATRGASRAALWSHPARAAVAVGTKRGAWKWKIRSASGEIFEAFALASPYCEGASILLGISADRNSAQQLLRQRLFTKSRALAREAQP